MIYFLTIIFITFVYTKSDNLECALKILNHYITKSDNLFINIADFNLNLNLLKTPIYNINFKKINPKQILIPPTIYLINLTENVQTQMEYYWNCSNWNPRAKFIFISNTLDLIGFEEFLMQRYIRSFVLLVDDSIYGWDFSDLSQLYQGSGGISFLSECWNFTELFEPKFYSNYNFLEIRACHPLNWPYANVVHNGTPDEKHDGFEIDALNVVVEKFNLSLKYVETPHIDILRSKIESISDIDVLLLNQSDIFFGKQILF